MIGDNIEVSEITLIWVTLLILKVSAKKKPIGSSAGMQTSVNTSPYLKHRIIDVVPDRMVKMTEAIKNKDFHTFAEHTMKVNITILSN